MIHIVCLGPGDPASLPSRAFTLLGSGLPVLLRTARHPTLSDPALQAALAQAPVESLDDEYERGASFDATYDAIVARVLDAAARHGDIVYAVPGHPLVGESTVARLLPLARERSIPITVVGAPSFVDACLEAIGEAVTGDLLVLDALSLPVDAPSAPAALRTDAPLLLYQVHSRDAASQAKLALMRAGYPDEYTVTVVHGAGIPGQEQVKTTPLYALDRSDSLDHLTSVWVPSLPVEARRPSFPELVQVMARLRAPAGCPWDREQTHESLCRYVLEEAYEVVDAVHEGDTEHLCEELGDLLLQVVFHAQLAAEEGVFDIEDVSAVIVEKLIRRHPHIFGDVKVDDSAEVLKNWQAIKATEKGGARPRSILDGISQSMPGLMQALEVSKRAVKAGFEWPELSDIMNKVDEELQELREEIAAQAPAQRIADEIGDLLFTVVNVARRSGIDPEVALRRQIDRFSRRFRHIEAQAALRGVEVDALSLDEMEAYWREAKAQEGRNTT